MADKTLKTRIQHKRGSSNDWSQATNFTPLDGELIVYNEKNGTPPKFKVGDGTTLVGSLPFATVENDSHNHTTSTITDFENSVNEIIENSGAVIVDDNGKISTSALPTIPQSLLPSYVDDVLEYSSKSAFPAEGETGKIYVSTDTNLTYRWSGSTYTEISPSLALGETNSTAYAGDKGAAAYKHAVTNKGIAKASGLYKITTNSEGHVTAASAVTKQDILNLGIVEGNGETVSGNYLPLSGGTMTGKTYLTNGSGVYGSDTGWTSIGFYGATQNLRGSLMMTDTNCFHFNQQETGSSFEERYKLPSVATGLTADVWYSILTSKNPVTIAQGGTGATTPEGAEYAISGGMKESTNAIDDDNQFILKRSSPSESDGVFIYKTGARVWSWIASKIRSIFGFTSTNILSVENGGTGATSATDALTNLGITATAAELNKLGGITATTTELNYIDGVTSNIQTQLNDKAPTSHASTATIYGASSASNYGHAMASSTTPKALGTAAVGSETAKFARGDHVHPLPALTSCTGTLTVAQGGTGATTAKEAEYNILKDMATASTAINDDTTLVVKRSTPSATAGVLVQRPITDLTTYLSKKYLPLSGGTITGTLYRQGSNGSVGFAIGTADVPECISILLNRTEAGSNGFGFRQYGSNGNRENFNLPRTATPEANANYTILTSKNAVTIAQGGTGATTAADARTELGITLANLGDVIISTTTPTTVTNGKWYLIKQG